MKTSVEWIDTARSKLGLTDYALAPLLGISRAQMSRYRTGKDGLSDDCALKLAGLLGMKNAMPIIASAHADRAKSEDVKTFWTHFAGIAASAFGLVIAAVMLAAAPNTAQAGTNADYSNNRAVYIMYSGIRMLVGLLAAWNAVRGLMHSL